MAQLGDSSTHQKRRITHLNSLFEKVELEDPCPKCGSYYVLKTKCESCGFHFNLDTIGLPGEERSFYTFKEDYQDQCPWGWAHYPYRLKMRYPFFRRYLRKIVKRFTDLVQVLDQGTVDRECEPHFMMECRHLIEEYACLGAPVQDLSLCLKGRKLNFLRDDLSYYLDKGTRPEFPRHIDRKKKHHFLVVLLATCFMVITFSLLLFRFLTLTSA